MMQHISSNNQNPQLARFQLVTLKIVQLCWSVLTPLLKPGKAFKPVPWLTVPRLRLAAAAHFRKQNVEGLSQWAQLASS